MAISVGDTLPEASFYSMGDDGPTAVSTGEVFSGKKCVLFAVPGAFTPTCHMNHLPGYVTHAQDLRDKGVDEIAVVSVNDVFVMDAWAKSTGGEGKIRFLCDPNGDFTKAIGMELNLVARGLGVRSMRYAMIVEDGKVTTLNVEDNPGEAVASSAGKILEAL